MPDSSINRFWVKRNKLTFGSILEVKLQNEFIKSPSSSTKPTVKEPKLLLKLPV